MSYHHVLVIAVAMESARPLAAATAIPWRIDRMNSRCMCGWIAFASVLMSFSPCGPMVPRHGNEDRVCFRTRIFVDFGFLVFGILHHNVRPYQGDVCGDWYWKRVEENVWAFVFLGVVGEACRFFCCCDPVVSGHEDDRIPD